MGPEREQRNHLPQESAPGRGEGKQEIWYEHVADALRNLADVSYLGNHPLSSHLAVARLFPPDATHLERGRAVRRFLMQGMAQLRPERSTPEEAQGEWLPFLVLHDVHWLGEARQEVMHRLAISEGTFNRTRRKAVVTLTQVLQELAERAPRFEDAEPITGWEDVARRARLLLGREKRKTVAVLSTDAAGWVLGFDVVHRGTLRIAPEAQRGILRTALLRRADEMYLLGWAPEPIDHQRGWDESEVRRLYLAAEHVGLTLRDAILVNPRDASNQIAEG